MYESELKKNIAQIAVILKDQNRVIKSLSANIDHLVKVVGEMHQSSLENK